MRYPIANKICTKSMKTTRNMREFKAKKKNLVLTIVNKKAQANSEAEL